MVSPDPQEFGIVALDGTLPIGFAYTRADDDHRWGSRLENIHVTAALRRIGAGLMLLRAVGRQLMSAFGCRRLHPWVYEDNFRARAFYERHKGLAVELGIVAAPDGFQVARWRHFWEDAGVALRQTGQSEELAAD